MHVYATKLNFLVVAPRRVVLNSLSDEKVSTAVSLSGRSYVRGSRIKTRYGEVHTNGVNGLESIVERCVERCQLIARIAEIEAIRLFSLLQPDQRPIS